MPSPEEIEQKIYEQRSIEANKKGLVGQTGKIGTVLRIFGNPIIAQIDGGGYVDTNYLENYMEEIDEEPRNNIDFMKKMPVIDMGTARPEGEEWSEIQNSKPFGIQQIGVHFDGLSRGMHMEIKYDEFEAELILTYKGYLVYKETKGEILTYVPITEWESWINYLYKKAKEKQRKLKEEEFENKIIETEKSKHEWWKKMISKWGIK
jgi:hypothetical protein